MNLKPCQGAPVWTNEELKVVGSSVVAHSLEPVDERVVECGVSYK